MDSCLNVAERELIQVFIEYANNEVSVSKEFCLIYYGVRVGTELGNSADELLAYHPSTQMGTIGMVIFLCTVLGSDRRSD